MFTPTPSVAKGDVIPYLPSCPVISPCSVRNVEAPSLVPDRYRYLSACGVTPPSAKMLYGTQVPPTTHTGLAAVPVTCRALTMPWKFKYLSLELKNVV